MTEKKLWGRIRAWWEGHAVRVEASAGGVDAGFPDGILSIGGRGAYVELKVWPEELRPMQLPWHLDCLDRGGGCEVWCWVGDGIWCGRADEYAVLIERGVKPSGTDVGSHCERLRKKLLKRG